MEDSSNKTRRGRPTLRDVAAEAGVGAMTVSRVVNGVPGSKVSEATAARVREAVDKLGYETNEVARGLRVRQSRAIGLVVPDIGNPFFANCSRVIEEEARRRGFITILVASDEDAALENRQIALLRRRHVEGIVLVPAARPRGDSAAERLGHTPVVAIDRPLAEAACDCVLVENREGTRAAIEHLIAHGHRRIAFVGYGPEIYAVEKRVFGYQEAMTGAGLPEQIRIDAHDWHPARKMAAQLLHDSNRPTAIFALNNMVLRGVWEAAAEAGMRVPDDLALIGFEDFPWATLLNPPVTVVDQPGEEMSRRAAELLFERIEGTRTSASERVVLPTRLTIRASCGCPVTPRKMESTQP